MKAINERMNEMKLTFESKENEAIIKKQKIEKMYEEDLSLLEEVYFGMNLNLKNISLTFYGGEQNLNENIIKIFNLSFINLNNIIRLKKDESYIELNLQKIKLYECNNSMEKFAYVLHSSNTEEEENIISITIIQHNSKSKVFKGVELELDIKLGIMNIVWNPSFLRSLIQLLTTDNSNLRVKVQSYLNMKKKKLPSTDIEKIKVDNELNNKEAIVDYLKDQTDVAIVESCRHNKNLLVKLSVSLSKTEMVLLHPILKFNISEIKLAKTTFTLDMFIDHMIIKIQLGNVQLFDLSDYPYTIISQNQYKEENKKEILGFKDESSMIISIKLYDRNCELFKDNYSSEIEVLGKSVVLNYYQEQLLRFITYFQNEIIGIKNSNESKDNLPNKGITEIMEIKIDTKSNNKPVDVNNVKKDLNLEKVELDKDIYDKDNNTNNKSITYMKLNVILLIKKILSVFSIIRKLFSKLDHVSQNILYLTLVLLE